MFVPTPALAVVGVVAAASSTVFPGESGVVRLATVLTALGVISLVGRRATRRVRALWHGVGDAVKEINGTPARPGYPARPGLAEWRQGVDTRLAGQDDDLAAIKAAVGADTGGHA